MRSGPSTVSFDISPIKKNDRCDQWSSFAEAMARWANRVGVNLNFVTYYMLTNQKAIDAINESAFAEATAGQADRLAWG